FAAEDLGPVGHMGQGTQVVLRDVGDEKAQDLERQLGIRQAAPGLQRGRIYLRQRFRNGQPAVGRQAFEQDLGKGRRRHGATCGYVSHVYASCSMRRRTTSDLTVGNDCIFSIAVITSRSSATWVRKMISALSSVPSCGC